MVILVRNEDKAEGRVRYLRGRGVEAGGVSFAAVHHELTELLVIDAAGIVLVEMIQHRHKQRVVELQRELGAQGLLELA